MDNLGFLGKPILSGHEKFIFRYGWLKKGIDAAARDPYLFNSEQALVELGVGKNMVRSIRHWCLATGLLMEGSAATNSTALCPTDLAGRLLTDQGWDPFLEDAGTLWLLHWQLATNPIRGIVWHAIFGHFYEPEFSKRQMLTHVSRYLERAGINAKGSTVEQNVDICLRAYVPAKRNSSGIITEDTFDSPLVELDLIRAIPEEGVYRFNIGPKGALSPAIFAYAVLSYAPGIVLQRRVLNVEDCIHRPGSPGQIFKLDENTVVELLEKVEEMTGGTVRLQETAGIRQLYFADHRTDDFTSLAYQLLDQYYARHDL